MIEITVMQAVMLGLISIVLIGLFTFGITIMSDGKGK